MMTDDTTEVTPADVAQRLNQPDLETRLAEAEAARVDAELRALRAETAIRFGLDAEDRDLLLTGTDFATLEMQAARLAERYNERRIATSNVAPNEGKTSPIGVDPKRRLVRQVFGRDPDLHWD